MKTIISGTYGKTRDFEEMDKLPEVGSEWIGRGYEDARVVAIDIINDEVAETTSGDPKARFNFYRVTVEMDGDEFQEYVAIPGGYLDEIEKKETPQARYDRKMTKVITMKLNKGTDADILARLEGVDNVQGYIKRLIREDMEAEVIDQVDEIMDKGLYDAAVNLMDDDLRKDIHAILSPCSDREFLTMYLIRHKQVFGDDFCL